MSQDGTNKSYLVSEKLVDQIVKYHKYYDEVEPSWKLIFNFPKNFNFDDRDEVISHLRQNVPYRNQWWYGLRLYECYDSKNPDQQKDSRE